MIKKLERLENTVNKYMADIRRDRLMTCQSERKSVVSRRPSVLKSLSISDFNFLNLYIIPLEAYGSWFLVEGDGIEVNWTDCRFVRACDVNRNHLLYSIWFTLGFNWVCFTVNVSCVTVSTGKLLHKLIRLGTLLNKLHWHANNTVKFHLTQYLLLFHNMFQSLLDHFRCVYTSDLLLTVMLSLHWPVRIKWGCCLMC
jgi:hypothetical protein